MGKLWDKDYTLDEVIERFTVGNDYVLDQNLVNADCVASIAHSEMLSSIGILSDEEHRALRDELIAIVRENDRTGFTIAADEEDCHTSIENRLTAALGDTGKKIHTGRSRNDQVIVDLRLYGREFLLVYREACADLAETLVDCAERNSDVPMPGRTHMQIAMPSSVGLWAAAFAEQLLDDVLLLETAYQINNMSPLGSAASYGVPLPLDRELVARSLGFDKVQNNVLYVNNSRGKVESIIVDAIEQTMITVGKLAQDMILFSMPEFGYFTLPDEVCTGSSIMPQKKNPGLLELTRARASTVAACGVHIKGVIRSVPSGYNRDFQETKEPFMKALGTGMDCIQVMQLGVRRTTVNREKLLAGFRPEIYATDYALELVAKGVPFRDAYREVAQNLGRLQNMDAHEAIRKKKHRGATGNLGLELSRRRIAEVRETSRRQAAKVADAVQKLVGFDVHFYQPTGG